MLELSGMTYAEGAGLDTRKQCLQGTRTEILSQITEWVNSTGDNVPRMPWLVDNKQTVFKPLLRRTGQDWSVCFSPDGKRLARGHDETVIICDAKTGAVPSTLHGGGAVYCIAFSSDGLNLTSGTERKIRVWSTDNTELPLDIDAHDGSVHSI